MVKKIKLEMTEYELKRLLDIVDNISAMLGEGSDFTGVNSKSVKVVDKMLNRNGFKRVFK